MLERTRWWRRREESVVAEIRSRPRRGCSVADQSCPGLMQPTCTSMQPDRIEAASVWIQAAHMWIETAHPRINAAGLDGGRPGSWRRARRTLDEHHISPSTRVGGSGWRLTTNWHGPVSRDPVAAAAKFESFACISTWREGCGLWAATRSSRPMEGI